MQRWSLTPLILGEVGVSRVKGGPIVSPESKKKRVNLEPPAQHSLLPVGSGQVASCSSRRDGHSAASCVCVNLALAMPGSAPGPCSPGGCTDASACGEQGRGQKERPSQIPVIQTSHPACLSAGEVDSQVTDCREALRLPPTLSELRTLHCPSLWGTGRLTCEQGQSGALTRANTFWPSAPFRLDFC